MRVFFDRFTRSSRIECMSTVILPALSHQFSFEKFWGYLVLVPGTVLCAGIAPSILFFLY